MEKTTAHREDGRRRALAATCLASGLVLAVIFSTGMRNPQAAFGDFLVQLSPKPVMPFGVALVGIDPSSLNLDQLSPEEIAASPALQAMKQGFPWSRSVYAGAIERLIQSGARLVLVDVMMRGPREGDEDLRKVLEKYADRIVLVSTFAEDASGSGRNIVRYQLPSESLLESGKIHVGFANFWRDEDQVVRVAPFRLRPPGTEEFVPSAAAAMLSLLGGKERAESLPAEAAFIPGRQALRESMTPLWMLFDAKAWSKDLKGGVVFRNKVVAIGSFYSDEHDEFQTPAGNMPGVAMHVGVLAAAWQGAFFAMPGAPVRAAGTLLASLAALAIALIFRHIIPRSLVFGAVVLLIIASGIGALAWLHFQIPLLPLLSGLLVSGVGTLVVDLVAEGRARHRARRMLERYFSPQLAREMLDKRDSFLESLGGSHREVTVLVSDLRGFTSLAESADPVELLADLNDYLGRMTSLIFGSGGGVDKFLGDGILAVWGTLDESRRDSPSAPALGCAEKMLAGLRELNALRVSQGKPEWHLGIGIHSGPVIFGNVGSTHRMELTVIGDTVNLASRVEGLNKAYATEILFTDSTREHAGAAAGASRSVDRIRVGGRTQAVDLFTIWDAAVPREERDAYENGVRLYRQGGFSDALGIFQTLRATRPADPLCILYFGRCGEQIANPTKGLWDGISQAKSK